MVIILLTFFLIPCITFFQKPLCAMSYSEEPSIETVNRLIREISLHESFNSYLFNNPETKKYLNTHRESIKNILIHQKALGVLPYYSSYAEMISGEEYEKITQSGSLCQQALIVQPNEHIMTKGYFSHATCENTLIPETLPGFLGLPTMFLDEGPYSAHAIILCSNQLIQLSKIIIWDKHRKQICQAITHAEQEPIIYLAIIQDQSRKKMIICQHKNIPYFYSYRSFEKNYYTFTLEQLFLIALLFEGDFLIPEDYRQAVFSSSPEFFFSDQTSFLELAANHEWQAAYNDLPLQTRILLEAVIKRWSAEKKNNYLQQSMLSTIRNKSSSLIHQLSLENILPASITNSSPTAKSPLDKNQKKIRNSLSVEGVSDMKITRPIHSSGSLEQIKNQEKSSEKNSPPRWPSPQAQTSGKKWNSPLATFRSRSKSNYTSPRKKNATATRSPQ